MSRYSGMSVENSIAAYAEDCGNEEMRQEWCHEQAAEMTERNIIELRNTGSTELANGSEWDLQGIVNVVNAEFWNDYTIDNIQCYFLKQDAFMPDMIDAAIDLIEPWIYEINYENVGEE